MEKQEEEEENPRLEPNLFHNKLEQERGKSEKSSVYRPIKDGSHNLQGLLDLEHGFLGLKRV